MECTACDGCGEVAAESGEPWTAWTSLPYASQLSIRLGLVRPEICTACKGTGVKS